jgi:signal transduction histidine kinase
MTAITASEHYKNSALLAESYKQIAHDIRSPLLVLELLSKEFSHNDADASQALSGAIARIQDIASKLLPARAGTSALRSAGHEHRYNIISLCEDLLSDKRIEYKNRHNTRFVLNTDGEVNARPLSLSYVDLRRVLSNVINNAVESLKEDGSISLLIGTYEGHIKIAIKDNGRGIPREILPKIGQPGFSYDKENGHGMGFAHAIKTVGAVGGHIHIDSEVEVGTVVSITLPFV